MASPLSFGAHTVAALRPQAAKVNAIYNMNLGWEVWAQIELALEMAATVRSGGRAELEFGRFEREFAVYHGHPQWRADFILEASLAHVRHFHFGELKCLIQRETPTAFAGRVAQDIAKVKGMRPAATWVGAAPRAVTGHVIAITVGPTPAHQQQLDAAMMALQQPNNIRWTVAALSNTAPGSTIRVWTWSRPIIANGRPVP